MCHAPNTRRAHWLAKSVVIVVSILFARLPVLIAGDDTPLRPSPIVGVLNTRPPTLRLLTGIERAISIELIRGLRAAARRGDFAKTEQLASELVSLYRETHGANHWQTVTLSDIAESARRACKRSAADRERLAQAYALCDRCDSLKNEGDSRAALRAAREALRIYMEVMGVEDVNTVAMRVGLLAPLQVSLGLKQDAKLTFSKGIDVWRGLVKCDNPECASALNDLGCVCSELKDFEEAETYYTASVEMMRAAHVGLLNCMIAQCNLVQCYNARGKFQRAETLARRTMRMANGPPPELLARHAKTHVHLALSLAGQDRFNEAFSHFEEIIDVYEEQKNSATAAQWVELFGAYAASLRLAGRTADAKAYADKAARYQAKSAQARDDHSGENRATAGNDAGAAPPGESAEFKAKLGALRARVHYYMTRGDFQAELRTRRALLSALRRELGPEHRTTISLQEIIRCIERICETDAASQRRFTHARGLYIKAFKLVNENDDRHALSLLKTASRICREVTGDESIFTVTYVERLAEVQDRLGQLNDAKESYTLALRARQKFTDKNDYDNATRMQHLAARCLRLENYKEAEKWLLRAKPIYQAASPGETRNAVVLALTFAQLYKSTGRLEQAERTIRDTIQGAIKLGPEADDVHALSLLELSDILAAQNKHGEADVAYQRAEHAFETVEVAKASLSLWQRLCENYATTLRALGRNERADAYAAKAARAATVQKMTTMQ